MLIVSLAAGIGSALWPVLFPTILFIDLWFLGYHHVVSTYTRISFDKESFREHKFFVLYLPFIIAALTLVTSYFLGAWSIATVYLYWQWFHYSRQSYGINRIYQKKEAQAGLENDYLEQMAFYALPVWGILSRSSEGHEQFLWLPVVVLPVPELISDLVGLCCLALLAAWTWRRFQHFRKGELAIASNLYFLSHNLIFLFAYVAIADINFGWLAINVWHNFQYILLVWHYNANKFASGVESDKKFLSTISQSENFLAYFAVCLLLSSAMYIGIDAVLNFVSAAAPYSLIVYSVINFHHYVVDGAIWKLRRKPVSNNFGVSNA